MDHFALRMPALERIILWENDSIKLSSKQANLLEDVCQRIWITRKLSPTYAKLDSGSSEFTETRQTFMKFNSNRDGNISVTPSHYIGLINVSEHHYVIFPKIYKGMNPDQILELLRFQFAYAYGLKLPESHAEGIGSAPEQKLFAEALYYSFASEALNVLRKRSFLSYQEVQENIQTVRGRIDFPRHLRENFWRARHDRFNCVYEIYQEDCLFSRILKHVATLVRSRARSKQNITLLTEILMRLDEVQDQRCRYPDCLRVRLTRYQHDFIPILQYCMLFLSFRMANASAGDYQVDYYLINTNELFERFVAGYLKATCSDNWIVKPKIRGFLAHDDAGKIFQYENDALLTSRRDHRRILVDMKYKIVDFDNRKEKYGISQNDLYQMIAYATKRGIPDVLLIYPGCGLQSTSFRHFKVENSLGGHPIRITACRIPMDNTNHNAIREAVETAIAAS
jgi:5-methylcytosine-specific restriction enzyme subunit McrC